MKADFRKHRFRFKRPGGTSRGILTQKDSWLLCLENAGERGIGECSIISGLSPDDEKGMEPALRNVCAAIQHDEPVPGDLLRGFPSIRFGLEQALLSLAGPTPFELYPSEFTGGRAKIPINGLIWMGTPEFMREQVREKLAQGFRCLKLKIGALDFQTEWHILKSIRKEYAAAEVEIRVDANGAFSANHALERLNRLAELELHSIEQPIAAGQWEEMAVLCAESPLPIALDEELIGVDNPVEKQRLLETIRPAYLVLKPSLLGGIAATDAWIDLAGKSQTGWWITSALEGNIGLNAIAQYTYCKASGMYQGLGTGSLFINNFDSPLQVEGGYLWYRPERVWSDQIFTKTCT